ncbi:hypothetical protein AB4Y43_07010 [Paraburkholderia sp. BR10872]|uniref:hypothetical protein n=1 Tax=Paraburkholderia sp. BR10872 TaxID=3236989 RepID=UPI0034D26BD1
MLTGNTRYRLGWRKKIVLQAEYWYWPPLPVPGRGFLPIGGRQYLRAWRDATFADVIAIERGEVQRDRPETLDRLPPPPKRSPGDKPV